MAYALLFGLFLLFSASLVVSKTLTGRYVSPFPALPASFLISAFIYVLNRSGFYEIPGWGVVLILIGVALFEVGAIAGYLMQPTSRFPKSSIAMATQRQERNLYRFVVVLFILGLIGALYQIYSLVNNTGLPLLAIYRDHFYLVDRGFLLSGWAWLYNLNMLTMPLCAIYLTRYTGRRSSILIMLIVAMMLMALKGDAYYLLVPVLTASFAVILENPKLELRTSLLAVVSSFVLALLFFVITYSFYFGTYQAGFDKFASYAAGSLVSFGSLIEEGVQELSLGASFAQQFLSALEIEAPTTVSPGVTQVGHDYLTNVYTLFGTFYTDFGVAGILVFSLVLGLVSGWAFKIYRRKSSSIGWLMLVSQIMTALSLSFFANFFGFVYLYFQILMVFVIEKLFLNPTPSTNGKEVINYAYSSSNRSSQLQ